jgi:hypothetical protein
MSCVCPAGQKTRKVVSISSGDRYGAPGTPLRAFRFDAAVCEGCPLRPKCVRARPGKGRLVMIHPQEALLQEARAFQKSEAFAPYRKLRQAAEHRLARLVQLGARQPATSVEPRRFSSSLWQRPSPISRSWRGGSATCETATTPRRTTPYTAGS